MYAPVLLPVGTTIDAQDFETLLLSSNSLNRKLEEVLGMTREYDTIASLWQSFHDLMRGQKSGIIDDATGPLTEERLQGLPGTGSHVLGMTNKE